MKTIVLIALFVVAFFATMQILSGEWTFDTSPAKPALFSPVPKPNAAQNVVPQSPAEQDTIVKNLSPAEQDAIVKSLSPAEQDAIVKSLYMLVGFKLSPAPPPQLTILGTGDARLSDAVIATAQLADEGVYRWKDGFALPLQGIEDMRFTLGCENSNSGCVQLPRGTYWMRYIYPGDDDYDPHAEKSARDAAAMAASKLGIPPPPCHPAKFGRNLGGKAIAAYDVCVFMAD